MFLKSIHKQQAQNPKLGPESRKPVRKVGETKDGLERKQQFFLEQTNYVK